MASRSPLRPESLPTPMRRRVIQSLGLLTAAPWLARADSTGGISPLPLPLRVKELVNHIGSSVPDVTRSASFYSHLFQAGTLLGQDKPALRYEIDFRPGALSIGPLMSTRAGAQRHSYIDHFCMTTQPFDATAWRARLVKEKVRNFAAGSFVVIGGVSVQLLGGRIAPPPGAASASGGGGSAGAARHARKGPPPAAAGGFKPMPALFDGQALVSPRGFEHLSVHVADLEASAALFERLFGLTSRRSSPGLRLFRLGDIRLELREAPSGEPPSIETFAIRVDRFDPARIRAALEELGATVGPLESSGKRTILRFSDPDGIKCELWA